MIDVTPHIAGLDHLDHWYSGQESGRHGSNRGGSA